MVEEHVKILRQGVGAWNKWREDNPNAIPNLREADLSEADIGWANLGGANLVGADLHEANLRRADL